jgi:nucleotide-binding universal stress UspA family protein
MEKILVGMDASAITLWAPIHAINLGKRIKAKVYILLVISPGTASNLRNLQEEMEAAARNKVEALIDEGRSEGVVVDYYITYGTYEGELIKFIEENEITLLVVGFPPGGEWSRMGESVNVLENIRHRINCRIEVVHERAVATKSKRR